MSLIRDKIKSNNFQVSHRR